MQKYLTSSHPFPHIFHSFLPILLALPTLLKLKFDPAVLSNFYFHFCGVVL